MSFNRKSLESFFRENTKVAVACSGGVDSTFLVHKAAKMGVDVLPIIVRSRLACHGEVDMAIDFCHSEGLEPAVVDVDILSAEGVVSNGPDRCYHCKYAMFEAIRDMTSRRGYDVVADGTNASDPEDERPGMRALRELGIRSPLRDAGLTKSQIRRLARSDRLVTWNKVSNSCLATRVPEGTVITEDLLIRIGDAENIVAKMGFSGFRVRSSGSDAVLMVPQSQYADAERRLDEITSALDGIFDNVALGIRKTEEPV